MDKIELYKNFLPKKIYMKRKQRNIEKEKTVLLIILGINIIFSFEVINKLIKASEKEVIVSSSVSDKKILLNKQLDLFENIIIEGEIINGRGEIKTKEENVSNIEKKIKLNSIELQEEYAYLKFEGD